MLTCILDNPRVIMWRGRAHLHGPAASHAADANHLLKRVPDAVGRHQHPAPSLGHSHLRAGRKSDQSDLLENLALYTPEASPGV